MRVFLLPRMSQDAGPTEPRSIVPYPVGAVSAEIGSAVGGNPLGGGGEVLGELRDGGRVVAWSGWLDAEDGESGRPTWGPAGWSAFEAMCDRVAPVLAQCGSTLCLRPHHSHVLSDPQSCLTFLRRRGAEGFEVLLDPAGFLAASMVARVEEHFERAAEALGRQVGVAGVVLTNLEAEGRELRASPLHRGILDPGMLVGFAAGLDLPVLLLDEQVDEQMRVLSAAGV
jgi:hypothetical protein